jgi:stage II sporulation protein M
VPRKKLTPQRLRRYVEFDFLMSLRRNARLLAIVVIAFLLVIALGVVAGIWKQSATGKTVRSEVEPELRQMENEVNQMENNGHIINVPNFTAHIISNNLLASVEIIALGIFFGIFPIFALAINGLVLGYVYFYVSDITPLKFFSVILPHGLIELSALMIAITCGLRLGVASLTALTQRDKRRPLRNAGRDVLNILPVVFLLLTIAGLIEGFISPLSGTAIAYAKIALGITLFGALVYWFTRTPKLVGQLEPA